MVRCNHSLSLDATIMVSKNCPTIGEHVVTILQYSLLKTPLITALGAYNSKTARWNFYILSTFDKHDKTQLLAKFKKNSVGGVQSHLIFSKIYFKNLMYLFVSRVTTVNSFHVWEDCPSISLWFKINFRKFKVALNSTYRIFLNFAKSCVLSCLSNVDNIKNFTLPFLNYKPLKL